MISSPCLFTVRVCVAVSCDCSLVCFSISAICWRCCDGAEISIPRMMSRISDWVSEATFTLDEEKGKINMKYGTGAYWITSNIQSLNEHLLVLFAIICQDEVFQLHLNLDPLLVSERGPDVMGLSDGRLVGFQNHLGTVVVDMEGSEDEDQSGEGLKMEQSTKCKLLTQGGKRDATKQKWVLAWISSGLQNMNSTQSV